MDTLDVDVVHSRDAANIARLLVVLESLDAIYRIQPNASHLESAGHQNLVTRYGPLDFLQTIGKGLAYADLIPIRPRRILAKGSASACSTSRR